MVLTFSGTASDAVISTEGLAVTLVYVDATKGWIVTDSGNQSDAPLPTYITATGGCITTCGNFKMHTFYSPNTFVVCSVGNCAGSNTVSYMVVAGGAGGGWDRGGGGGAGGFRESKASSDSYTASPLNATCGAPGYNLPVSATPYAIVVGGGGNGGVGPSAPTAKGKVGFNSSFFNNNISRWRWRWCGKSCTRSNICTRRFRWIRWWCISICTCRYYGRWCW